MNLPNKLTMLRILLIPVFMLVESSSDKITLGRTKGSTVPGGAVAKSSAHAPQGASAAPAARASRVLRKRGGVLRGMVMLLGRFIR